MMDWESHKIITKTGRVQARVYEVPGGRLVVRTPLSPYASSDGVFESMTALEAMVRKRGWRLEKASIFSST
jgi:hypothetical protein